MVISEFNHKRMWVGWWCYYRRQGCSVGDRSSGLWGHVGPSPGVFCGGQPNQVFFTGVGFLHKEDQNATHRSRQMTNQKKKHTFFNLSAFWQNCTLLTIIGVIGSPGLERNDVWIGVGFGHVWSLVN